MTSPARAALILGLAARAGIGTRSPEEVQELLAEQFAASERTLAEQPTPEEATEELMALLRGELPRRTRRVELTRGSEHPCAGCGREIVGRYSNARWCSQACRCRAWRRARGLTGFPAFPWLSRRGRVWWNAAYAARDAAQR